jgi:hypothetical protein
MEPVGRQQPLPQSASAATALVLSGDISAAPRCAGSSRNRSLSADLRPAAAGAVHLPSLRSGSARSSISLGALPLRAIARLNFYKVEKWTRDGTKVDSLLYAGNNLDKARRIFERAIKHRPRIRLTIRQRTRVLQEWPQK